MSTRQPYPCPPPPTPNCNPRPQQPASIGGEFQSPRICTVERVSAVSAVLGWKFAAILARLASGAHPSRSHIHHHQRVGLSRSR